MPDWHALLDHIVARKGPIPSHVNVLRLPPIDGWEPGRVWCAWPVDPDLIQPQGALFGGYISAIADEMLGLATLTVLPNDAAIATADARTNYFRPIREGIITIEATVIHQGRTNIFVEATFTDDAGKLCAKAAATQSVLSTKG